MSPKRDRIVRDSIEEVLKRAEYAKEWQQLYPLVSSRDLQVTCVSVRGAGGKTAEIRIEGSDEAGELAKECFGPMLVQAIRDFVVTLADEAGIIIEEEEKKP